MHGQQNKKKCAHNYIGISVYIQNDFLHFSANHLASFRKVKYKGLIHERVQNETTAVSQPIHRYKITFIKTHNLKYVNIMC